MLVSDVVLRVSRAIGDDDKLIITEADMIRWANDAQIEIVRRTECLQAVDVSNTTTVGDGTYALPADFMMMKRVTHNNGLLKPIDIAMADEIMQGNATSQTYSALSGHYYIYNGFLYMDPNAPAAVLAMYYIKYPTALTAVGDTLTVPVHMQEDVVKYMLALARERLDQDDASQRMRNQFEQRLAESRHIQSDQTVDSYPAVRLVSGDYG